jgi:hypothetical protein
VLEALAGIGDVADDIQALRADVAKLVGSYPGAVAQAAPARVGHQHRPRRLTVEIRRHVDQVPPASSTAMGWLDYHLHEFSITAPDSESLSRLVATPDTGPPPVYRRSMAGRGKQLWRSQDYDVATDRRSPYVTEAPAR